jgi:plastocyanin
MRRFSRPLLIAASFAAVSVLAGCGGGGGGGGGKTVEANDGKVTIEAHDIHFDIGKINATSGPLEVTLLEEGNQQHTFVIRNVDGKLAVTPSEKSASGVFDLKPGEYEFYCDIPGHEGQGMKGTLVVK